MSEIDKQSKKYRTAKGLTQEQLGELVGVTTQAVSKANHHRHIRGRYLFLYVYPGSCRGGAAVPGRRNSALRSRERCVGCKPSASYHVFN